MPQSTKIKEYLKFKLNPELSLWRELERLKQELRREMDNISETLQKQLQGAIEARIGVIKGEVDPTIEKLVKNILKDIKGEPGIQGDPGQTPQRGKDYFTENDIKWLAGKIQSMIRMPKDGRDGESIVGSPGKDGKSIVGPSGRDGKDGNPGKDADENKIANTVINKIGKPLMDKLEEKLEEIQKALSEIKREQKFGGRRTLHRGGLKLVWTELLGTGDGTTTQFTLSAAPKASASLLMSVGGGLQFLGATEDFTLSGTTITFTTAPPLGAKVRALLFHSQ